MENEEKFMHDEQSEEERLREAMVQLKSASPQDEYFEKTWQKIKTKTKASRRLYLALSGVAAFLIVCLGVGIFTPSYLGGIPQSKYSHSEGQPSRIISFDKNSGMTISQELLSSYNNNTFANNTNIGNWGPDGTSNNTTRHNSLGHSTQDRKIIKSGTLHAKVENVSKAYDTVRDATAKAAGYIHGSSIQKDYYGGESMSITIRVKVDNLDGLLKDLERIGEIKNLSIASDDVTSQYTDTQSRIKNIKRLEERILKLLEDKTGNINDVLHVEKELARIREQIETMEGQVKLWDNLTSLATLRVDLYNTKVNEQLTPPKTEQQGMMNNFSNAFNVGLNGLGYMISGMIIVLCVGIPLMLVSLPIFYGFKRIAKPKQ